MAVKTLMWILAIGVGIWYLSHSINGDSISYVSMTSFMQATGACPRDLPAGAVCDISATNGCFLCPFVQQLFLTIGATAKSFWEALLNNLWILLALGFVVYLFTRTINFLQKASEQNEKMGTDERKLDFQKWFLGDDKAGKDGNKDGGVLGQLVRVLLVGAFLGALGFGGTGVLKTVSDITIRPVMFVGSELAMAATGTITAAQCPMLDNVNENENIIGPALKPFMCVVGNANSVILAGASGGFALMNFSWLGMGGGLFTWLAGLGLVIMFLFIGFKVFFDILNVVFRLVFIIIFLPIIIASYAYENVWSVMKGAVGNAIKILVNCAVRVIAITLKVLILYTIVAFAADEYFPPPLDNYSAILPPGMGANTSATDAANSKNVVANVFAKCEQVSLKDGVMDKDLFAACFQREKLAAPAGAFDFMDDGWNFFMLMLGIFLIYFYAVEKKIDGLFVQDAFDGKDMTNFGNTVKELGKKIWDIPNGIAKKVTGAIWPKK